MKTSKKFSRAIAATTFAIAALAGTACSPKEIAAVKAHHEATLQKVNSGGLSDAALARLAKCESTNNPTVVSSNGLYHGLYQFNRTTWNGIAAQVDPLWVGVAPSDAPAHVQDMMARVLYKQRGSQPWPHCGRYI